MEYHFCNETLRKEFYKHEWSLHKCEAYSIFVSQALYPVKGLHFMLEAMPLILKKFPNTKLYISGPNITKSDTLKEKLKKTSYAKYIIELIRKFNLKDNTIFTGLLDETEMCERYLKSNVFVCPSSIENIVCDILNISVSTGALLASKLFKVKSIGIVTDVPDMLALNPKKWSVKFNNRILSSFSEYVFLTEQMNNLINKKRKPYVVIEGQVDINMQHVENRLEDKYPQKVSIYAGMIQKKYGINTLVVAFLIAAQNGEELHIYGSEDYEEKLKEICKKHTNIRYFGVVPNDVVVKEEIKETLLINPRPTNEEYTKYSFPSKNMEYMASGTPLLTTKLSGMPEEYYPYVYLINDEIIDGLSKTLKDILTKNPLELHEKGSKAKEFALKKKNNVVQAEKILELARAKRRSTEKNISKI